MLPGDRLVIVVDGERGRGRRRHAAGDRRRPTDRRPGTRGCWSRCRRRRRRPAGVTDPVTDAERDDHRPAARPPAAGARGRRAPLPVRPARRRRDLAAAGGRHAVPDAVLPDLPAGDGRREPAGVGRPDARVAGRAGHRPRARRRLPGRARGLPGHPRRPRRAAHPDDRRRDARPGQVPARARRRTRWPPGPGVNPIGDRAVAEMGEWWAAGPCARPDARTAHDPGRRDRLRHQLHPAARRRRARPTGAHTDLLRRMEVVRLGQGVDATGRLAPEADRAHPDGARRVRRRRRATSAPTAVRMVATSATRDAANRGRLRGHGASPPSGQLPDVVTGRGGGGAVLPRRHRLAGRRGRGRTAPSRRRPPFLVVDIGGGSTEFVLGDADGVRAARSVDIGCVRLTERHLHGDPPTAERGPARPRPTSAPRWPRSPPRCRSREAATLVGLAGSVTTVAALALELPAYDPTPSTARGSRSTPSARSPPTCSPPTRGAPGGDAGHAPGPGRRHRRRRAGAAGAHGRVRARRGRRQRARHPRRHRLRLAGGRAAGLEAGRQLAGKALVRPSPHRRGHDPDAGTAMPGRSCPASASGRVVRGATGSLRRSSGT